MNLETRYFGEIEVDESMVINFEAGLPGFEDQHRFLILNNYDTDEAVPFMWLQSVDNPDLAFVISIPFFLRPDYEIDIPDDTVEKMGISSVEDVSVYTICRISGKVDDMMFNLKNPIIVNAKNHKAMQIAIDDRRYTSKEMFIKNN